jgi:hypothetical protein
MPWLRFALAGLVCLVAFIGYVVLYPRLTAAGHTPPDTLGWALAIASFGVSLASLVAAIASPASRR